MNGGTEMDVREKLVELLNGIIDGGFKSHSYSYESGEQLTNDEIASHLIAHGVTVQEWVSVEDKLPEVVSIHKGYRGTVKKSIRVLCVSHAYTSFLDGVSCLQFLLKYCFPNTVQIQATPPAFP